MGINQPFGVEQQTVVVMRFGSEGSQGVVVVAVATTPEVAKDIADGLNHKFAEKLIDGVL